MKNKTGTAEKVAENVKAMLFSGEIARGMKLPGETALAKRLGVGRSSVREALRLLSASGYVELKPNRGAFALVTSEDELPSARSWLKLNHEKVEELLSVRSCIEPFACELCAKNDFHAAAEWQADANRLVDLVVDAFSDNWSAFKVLMKGVGIDCGFCRPPYAPLTKAQEKACLARFAALKLKK